MNNNITIVDDHKLFAASLKSLVNSFDGFKVSNIYKNGREFTDAFQKETTKPAIVLLDIRMPVMDGLETMFWLKENYPEQKVLALTMEDDEATILQMVKLGCRGYLLKDIEPDEFHFSLKQVIDEGFYYTNEVSNTIKNYNEEKGMETITRRELEFLNLACSEMTYKEVAQHMNLSPKTIDGYRERLFEKLNVKSRIGLVLFAIKHKVFLI